MLVADIGNETFQSLLDSGRKLPFEQACKLLGLDPAEVQEGFKGIDFKGIYAGVAARLDPQVVTKIVARLSARHDSV